MSRFIEKNLEKDGIDRRGFLKCMAWVGTGTLCVLKGGVLKSYALSDVMQHKVGDFKGDLSFVQISDSHIGFNKAANPDVTATLREAIAKVNALPTPPAFVLHTGDLTHLSKPAEFDTLAESLKSLKTERVFYVPGEHDVLDDNGAMFRERFGQGAMGDGWHSFDRNGIHFVGLGERHESQGRRSRLARQRAARMAPKRCLRAEEQHPHCVVRAYSSLGRLSAMGLGHGR